MSTLKVDTIQDRSGNNSTPTETIASGTAKAWGLIQSDGTISADFNIGSVNRVTTGKYTVSFSTALSSSNYAVTATVNTELSSGTQQKNIAFHSASTSNFQVSINNGTSFEDNDFAFVVHALP